MSIIKCSFCGKESQSINFCNWDCHIKYGELIGLEKVCPNNLPITCIGSKMMEHEHADHPNYQFPIMIKNPSEETEEVLDADNNVVGTYDSSNQIHAVIFYNDSLLITLYECRYYFWSVAKNKYVGGLSGFDASYKDAFIVETNLLNRV